MSEYKNAQNMISNIREDISPEVFVFIHGVIWHTKIWNFIRKFEKIRRDNGSFYKTRIKQQTKAIWRNIIMQPRLY